MEYANLIIGLALLVVFVWLLIWNSKRSGFMHSLFRIDTIAGISAGAFLIVSFFS